MQASSSKAAPQNGLKAEKSSASQQPGPPPPPLLLLSKISASKSQEQLHANRLWSLGSDKADLMVFLAALDPLQKLFGGALGLGAASLSTQAQVPATPPSLSNAVSASNAPASVPRLAGLPPFRNAAAAAPMSASPSRGKPRSQFSGSCKN